MQPLPSHKRAQISSVVGEAVSSGPLTNSNSSSQGPSPNNRIRSATCLDKQNPQQLHKQGAVCLVVGLARHNQRKPNLPRAEACLAALPSGSSLRPNKQPTHLAEVGCLVA